MLNMAHEQLEAIHNFFRNHILQTCWKRKLRENKTIQFTYWITSAAVLYAYIYTLAGLLKSIIPQTLGVWINKHKTVVFFLSI